MNEQEVDLSVQLGKIHLKNPVMPASGTFGYGEAHSEFIDLNALGAVITKGTNLKPSMGNSEHRFTEVAGCASLISIGLQNVGVEDFIKLKLPHLRQYATPVIVNIAGDTVEDYVRLAEILDRRSFIARLDRALH